MGATTGRRRWTVLACVVLLAVAVIALTFQGAPQFAPPRIFLPPVATPRLGSGEDQDTGTPEPQQAPQETHLDLSWLLVAVIVIVVVILLALLWRLRRRRLTLRTLPPLPQAGDLDAVAAQAEPEPEPQAAPVRRGLDRALENLAGEREPRDAIERAWLGLEEGAADSGVRRLPAETPAEFSARVVARVAADRDAARVLLDLYLRARFSQAPIVPSDVESARRAVETLRASWSSAATRGAR